MFDRIFAPALAFLMLLAGTVTLAAGFFPGTRSTAVIATTETAAPPGLDAPGSLMLEPVLIHIKRSDALRRLQEEDSRLPTSSTAPQAPDSRSAMLQLARH